jgi:hypothetical protein
MPPTWGLGKSLLRSSGSLRSCLFTSKVHHRSPRSNRKRNVRRERTRIIRIDQSEVGLSDPVRMERCLLRPTPPRASCRLKKVTQRLANLDWPNVSAIQRTGYIKLHTHCILDSALSRRSARNNGDSAPSGFKVTVRSGDRLPPKHCKLSEGQFMESPNRRPRWCLRLIILVATLPHPLESFEHKDKPGRDL